MAREAHHPRRRLAGRRHEAQGLLGERLCAAANDDDKHNNDDYIHHDHNNNNAADDVNEHDNYEATELDINDEHVSAIERAVEGLARQGTAPDLD